jgi:hypothetical protein
MTILFSSITVNIAAELGIPTPETDMPGLSELVDDRLLIVALPVVVLPAKTTALKINVAVDTELVAAEVIVILVALTTVRIVAPLGIPVPITDIPVLNDSVDDIFVIVTLPLVIFPVNPLMAPSVGDIFLNIVRYPSLNLVCVWPKTRWGANKK